MNRWIEVLKKNSLEGVKTLIEQGEDINEENESGESVLAYALRSHCDFDILMHLLESGADMYDTDYEGVSIFEMAITYNNIKMVEYFIQNGIDVNETKRKSGFTPLMCASCYGRYDIAKILLDNAADKDAVDSKGLSSVDFARKMNKKSLLNLYGFDENSPKNTVYAR